MPKMPKKIAMLLPALNDGGAERVFINLAEEFIKQGHHVSLLVVKKEGAYLNQISKNITIHELGGQGMLRSILPLIRYLKHETPNALISALPGPNLIAIIARFLTTQCKTHLIITQHMHIKADMAITRTMRSKIRLLLLQVLYRFSDDFVCVSKGLGDDFAHYTGVKRDKIRIIYNPVYNEDILTQAKEIPDHPWLKTKSKPVLLCVGRLAPPKDFKTVIQAIKNLDVRLIILGEGPKKEELQNFVQEQNISNHVDFGGFVQNPYAYMKQADIFIHSSRFEGFGNVLVEAMSVGTPVIATDCPSGPAEILENGKYGALIPVGDVCAMENAIKELLQNSPYTSEDLHSRAACFTIKAAAKAYLNMIPATDKDKARV